LHIICIIWNNKKSDQSVNAVRGTSGCLFTDKYRAGKCNVGWDFNSWMLNLLVHHLTSWL